MSYNTPRYPYCYALAINEGFQSVITAPTGDVFGFMQITPDANAAVHLNGNTQTFTLAANATQIFSVQDVHLTSVGISADAGAVNCVILCSASDQPTLEENT